jgi:hypothetical protein
VVLTQPDIRQVQQFDLARNDFLWKVYWWGNHRDATLMKALRLHPSLGELVTIRKWPEPGQGFKKPSSNPKENRPAEWLLDFKVLPSDSFYRYGTIDSAVLESVPDVVHRRGKPNIQSGWRILIGRGVEEAHHSNGRVVARLEHLSYCFRSSIFGVNVNDAEDWERKVLIGILWSSLARYYYFMIASTWGVWHHEIHVEELMSLPIRFPEEGQLREKIIETVDKLMNWPVHDVMAGDTLQAVVPLEQTLDDAIFNLYGLSDLERDLVVDLCEVNLEFLYRDKKSKAIRPVERFPVSPQGLMKNLPSQRQQQRGLEGYLSAFLEMWNREIAPAGEFHWRVIRPPHVPMIAVVFTTQEVGDPLPTPDTTDEQEWTNVLNRCSEALRQPISQRIYIDSMIRVVTNTELYVIKRDERRLWTRSMAREDAEATLVRAMYLQEEAMKQIV